MDSLRQRLLTLLGEWDFLQRKKKQEMKEAYGSNMGLEILGVQILLLNLLS